MMERLYLIHSNRGDFGCPACGCYIIWRKVGEKKYCPCDKEPVLCIWEPHSSLRVVYKGELVSGVKILSRKNVGDFIGKKPFYALQPHVYTCTEIKHKRRNINA